MDPAELSRHMPAGTEDAQHLTRKRELVDPAWEAVGSIEELFGSRSNANSPGSTALLT